MLPSLLQTDPASCHRLPQEVLEPHHIYLAERYVDVTTPNKVKVQVHCIEIAIAFDRTHAFAYNIRPNKSNVWVLFDSKAANLFGHERPPRLLRLTRKAITQNDLDKINEILGTVKVPRSQTGSNTPGSDEIQLNWAMDVIEKLREKKYLSIASMEGLRAEFKILCQERKETSENLKLSVNLSSEQGT